MTANFEDILKSDFRWPAKGDLPFRSLHYDQDAWLEESARGRLYIMTEGYKNAADVLIDRACSDNMQRNFLVYPIIFCYRHYIELSLKALIAAYGQTVGISPIWDSHDLNKLWKSFQEVVVLYNAHEDEEVDQTVGLIIAEFAKIDPASFSHRYPVDTKGNPLPLGIESLSLEQLKDVMLGVGGYFSGCDGYLDNLKNAGE